MSRATRLRLLLLGAIALVVGAALPVATAIPAQASAGARNVASSPRHSVVPATTFPADGQGLYASCSPAEPSCILNLDTLAQARFQLVLNYSQFASNATITDEIAYGSHAGQLGLRVIWPMNNFIYQSGSAQTLAGSYPALSASMGQSGICPGYDGSNYAFVACFVRAVRDLPGTWGYYIGDELPASREATVRHMVDAICDFDSTHPRLYVATTTSNNAVNRTDLSAYARSYCDGYECHSDATVIAQDYYPVGSSPADQVGGLTGQLAAGVQALARQYGVEYGMVLQSHSLAQYPQAYPRCTSVSACPYPTQQQMLAMRDAVLAHAAPRLLLWYSYFDLERSDNFSLHWSDLMTAANAGKPVSIQANGSGTTVVATPTVPANNAPSVIQSSIGAPVAGDLMTPWGAVGASVIEVILQAGLLFVLVLAMRLVFRRPSAQDGPVRREQTR